MAWVGFAYLTSDKNKGKWGAFLGLYVLKERVRDSLKKIPFIYRIGHRIKHRREVKKKDALRRAYRAHGLQAMQDVEGALEKTGFCFFYTCGTLLGIVREGGMIAHDYDLDVALIKGPDFSWERLDAALAEIDFFPKRSFLIGDRVEQRAYARQGLDLDIFLEEPLEGGMMRSPYFYRRTTEKYRHQMEYSVAYMHDKLVQRVVKVPVQGFALSIPESPEDILYGNYGPSWRVPDPSYDLWQAPNLKKAEELRGWRINH